MSIRRDIALFFGNKWRAFMVSALLMAIAYALYPTWLVCLAPIGVMIFILITYPGSEVIGSQAVQDLGETAGALMITFLVSAMVLVFLA